MWQEIRWDRGNEERNDRIDTVFADQDAINTAL
jgi:hypothetical protein